MQEAVGRLGNFISQGVYTVTGPLHPFGGAVDIVVVEQQDGTFKSSPWYVRFGKFQGVLKAREKVVYITVNGVLADFHMYLDHKGEAFFLREIDAQQPHFYPPSSGDDIDDNVNIDVNINNMNMQPSLKSKSCDFDSESGSKIMVGRTSSRRSRILGLMFGRRSLKEPVEKQEEEEEEEEYNRVDSMERAEIAANLLDLKWSTNLSANQPSPKHTDRQTEEVLYRAGVGCEQVLHDTTTLLPQGTETEEVTKSVDLDMPVTEVSEFHSGAPRIDYSNCNVSTYDVADDEQQQTSPKSQTDNMDLEHRSTETDMKEKDVSNTLSSTLESLGDCLPRKEATRSPSASSEEQNFLFSDLDESKINDQLEGSTSLEYVDKEDHLSYENKTEKVDNLGYANCDLQASLENSTTENQMSDLEELRVISSPLAIPRNDAAGKEVEQHTGSLPNISSYSDSLGQHDVRHPLSQSLDSRSTSLPWTFPVNDNLEYLKSDEDKENQLSSQEPGAKDYHSSGAFNSTITNLPIGDPSTLKPSPGGNWKLWPFFLRRSGSSNAMPPTPSDVKNTTCGDSSENMIRTDADKEELKPNFMKTKVRENTPTSEQVALLNLKEGMNTVTFTFSTAMLGKQQVDARIYLWNWNTRIVISDVDGTITKSDVLGQFMPLVGIDWSQTGVAHLFSAIKENGYQLLFLSARSISQAYLTRQFLVNLKQDGKVLPDGPVVISPDGLFPSLYREGHQNTFSF